MPSQKSSHRFTKLSRLNWLSSPSKRLPHGFSGLISTCIGLQLIFCHSLLGRLEPFLFSNRIPFRVILYVISTSCNAFAGYRMAPSAPVNVQPAFRRCAVLQCCLCYFILRFMPHFEMFQAHRIFVRCVDVCVTFVSLLCTISFVSVAWDVTKNDSSGSTRAIAWSIMAGICGIALLSVYPLQLSVNNDEWWPCIQERYPLQGSGMVAYIYIPATITFSLILFGATLYLRKVISAREYGLASLVAVVICLLSTVLSQEYHIPYVSTQRIYLPCIDPLDSHSFEGQVLQALDFSLYARKVLQLLFDVEFES